MDSKKQTRSLLRMREVENLLGIGRSTVYHLMEHGLFPRPIRIGKRAVAWELAKLTDWIATRPEGGHFEPGGNVS